MCAATTSTTPTIGGPSTRRSGLQAWRPSCGSSASCSGERLRPASPLLVGGVDGLCEVVVADMGTQAAEQLRDVLAVGAAEPLEHCRQLSATVLRGLELENAVSGTQLEIQRQRPQ